MRFKEVKGFRTLLPDQFINYRFLDQTISNIVEKYGYFPIEPPAIEYADVLLAKGGLSIDQTKEIFLFKDYGNRDIGLRFDLTTPISRVIGGSYEEFKRVMPLRLYYFTKMWRYEQPQKGRYREFWQFGLELIDSETELADFETIEIAANILAELGLNDVKLFVSHRDISRGLLQYLKCSDYEAVMRIIDKKGKISDDQIIELVSEYVSDVSLIRKILGFNLNEQNQIISFLEQISDFNETLRFGADRLLNVVNLLKNQGINVFIDLSLARGFDYYTGIIYEANVFNLKDGEKQGSSLLGGGRYDGLIELFGGKKTPSVGFAIGVDRILELLAERGKGLLAHPDLHIIYDITNLEQRDFALKLVQDLRSKYENIKITSSINAYSSFGKLLKKELKFCSTNHIAYAIIIDDHLKENKVLIKDLNKKEQNLVAIDQFSPDTFKFFI